MAERDHKNAFASEYAYHRREWAVQRVGWAVMAVVLAAAIAGVFGSGPVSRTVVETGAQRVEYERFGRYGAQTTLTVAAARDTSATGDLSVRISHAFIDAYRVAAVTPEPKRTLDTGNAVAFVFDAAPTARIIFRLEPDAIGRHAGEVRIDSQSLHVSQFVYP